MMMKIPTLLIGYALAFPAQSAGPTSFGPLTLGMSKEEIAALKPTDEIFPTSPITPSKLVPPRGGKEVFDTKLRTPFIDEPLETNLVFDGGVLTEFSVNFGKHEHLNETIAAQISEKYGPGKVTDTFKDKQCLYRNGANFTVKNGGKETAWVTEGPTGQSVEAVVVHAIAQTCPSDLRYPSTKYELRSLRFKRIDTPAVEAKPKNLF